MHLKTALILCGAAVALGAIIAIGLDLRIGSRDSDPVSISLSPNPRPQKVASLRRDLERVPSPADGKGRAWFAGSEGTRPRVTAGSLGRWVIVYEAGAPGIARGGGVAVQFPPFVGWSIPQLDDPNAPGYVTVTTNAPGVRLRTRIRQQMMLRIRVGGRGLESGERIEITYGAGPARARADSYAERDSRFWIFVDGDGRGGFHFLPDSPAVDVLPGPPHRVHLAWRTTAQPGEVVRLHVSVLDGHWNVVDRFSGTITLSGAPEALEGPRVVPFAAADRGAKAVDFTVREEGRFRLTAAGPGGIIGRSDPLVVREGGARVLWGDLHGHSNLSDGTGLPEDYFRYARDVAGLDVAALTDHDHHGAPRYLSQHPEVWAQIGEQARLFDAPGRFVALRGYEWTSWLQGHRHVLYFGQGGEVLSALDPLYESPAQLWDALRGHAALSVPHHPAGGPIVINWDFAPDPVLEPVVETVSTHGSSEAADTPLPVRRAFPGHFVRDALDRGYRLGFIGSGDSHDGHPGCVQRRPSDVCGLAAILSEDLTRDSVLAALRARRVYATSGPRFLLWVTLDGRPMGSALDAAPSRKLTVEVVAPRALARIDLIRSGEVVESVPGEERDEMRFERSFADLRPGEYLYLRAVQDDGAAAWSSPFFFE